MVRAYLQLPRAVHILCLGTLINRAGTLLMPFLTLYLTTERGLGVTFATFAMGAHGAGAMLGALTGGHLADLIGRRTVMLTSLLGGAAILRLFGALTAPWAIIAAVVVFSILADMYRPAASAMIADLVDPEHRPHAYALMYVAVNLGFSVGATLGGIVATWWFVWLFWIDSLTAAVYAAIIFTMCYSSAIMFGAPIGGWVLERFGGAWLWGGSFVLSWFSALLYLSIHRRMAPKAHANP